jgi:hypothetical protein
MLALTAAILDCRFAGSLPYDGAPAALGGPAASAVITMATMTRPSPNEKPNHVRRLKRTLINGLVIGFSLHSRDPFSSQHSATSCDQGMAQED